MFRHFRWAIIAKVTRVCKNALKDNDVTAVSASHAVEVVLIEREWRQRKKEGKRSYFEVGGALKHYC